MRRPAVAFALAAAAALVVVGVAIGIATPSASCTPSDCDAWHRSDVKIVWAQYPPDVTATAGCNVFTLTSDGTSTQSCTWTFAGGSRSASYTLKKDATPPEVKSASPERGPDSNGWYNHPVKVNFDGSDATSGVSSCTSPTYSGPDSATATVEGSCSDYAGNASGTLKYTFQYDATPPQVSGAKTSRPPDVNGWFNHPVDVAFQGADALSGIDGCTALTYKGPDTAAGVKGTCKDKAGLTAPEITAPLKYDATPPKLTAVLAAVSGDRAVVRWYASKDAQAFIVERFPGKGKARKSVVFRGKGRSFTDRSLRSGVRYRYRVTAVDQAGNATAKTALARSGSLPPVTRPPSKQGASGPLLSPSDGAHVKAPVLLRWRAVPKASYYNVQLRDAKGNKILSLWPVEPQLQVPLHWIFEGVSHTLAPGRYRWDVWPGFGPRSAARYGAHVVTGHFVVTG